MVPPLYYRALCLRAIDKPQDAINDWDALIAGYAESRFWLDAWKEKSYTQWAYLDRYKLAAQTLLDYVNRFPESLESPGLLYDAARIYERNNDLLEAAENWERLINDYPSFEISSRGLFLAGISYYRLGDYQKAQVIFQRLLVLSTNEKEQSAAYLWVGKCQQAQGDLETANRSWEQAALRDPSGYYSERARELFQNRPPFYATYTYDLGFDLAEEREEAIAWMKSAFTIPELENLNDLADLKVSSNLQRGDGFLEIGQRSLASDSYEVVYNENKDNPIQLFRLLDHIYARGFYRLSIVISRRILDLAHFDDATSLNAPIYFNHIRFGPYYKNLILQAAKSNGIHPLLLFSVVRQESFFDNAISSSAGAQGLMQLMPATASDVVSRLNWPPNYVQEDLTRPVINLPLGANYLALQIDYFDQNIYEALAGYNAGPGNSQIWSNLAGGDPDLFLEIIRYDETRRYIIQIAEFMQIYRHFYERNP